jgi:predicted DNA-binding protein with PD1-like motif
MRLRQTDPQPELLLLVETGEELPRLLVDTCLQQGFPNVYVTGSGRAMSLTLEGGPTGRRRVAGPLEVLLLHGTLSQRGVQVEPELRVVACREMDTGLEMIGGLLLEGKFERAQLRLLRHVPATKGLSDSAQQASWSALAAASASLGEAPPAQAEPADDDVTPKPGDRVHHPKFGTCVVKGVDDSHLKVRLEGGRTVSLGLSHLTWTLKGEMSTGQRVFDLHVRRSS